MKLSDSPAPVPGIDNDENSPPAATPKQYEDEELAEERDTETLATPEDGVPAHAPAGLRRQSNASVAFDIGDKGYLSQSERALRNYDMNNDGHLAMEEIKAMARDLSGAQRGSSFYKKFAIGAMICLLISFVGNFGLTWSVVKLTQQLDTTDDGALVNARTGKAVATQAKGNHVDLAFDNEHLRRLTEKIDNEHLRRLAEKFEEASRRRGLSDGSDRELLSSELRMLTEGVPALTMVGCDGVCAAAMFRQSTDGTDTSFSFPVGNTTYSGTIASGVTQALRSSPEGCDNYSNIHKVGDVGNALYYVACCGNEDCQVRCGLPDPSSCVSI